MLFLIGILFVLVGGVVLFLALENYSTMLIGIHLTLFRWHSPTLPLGVALLLSCVCGALLVYVVSVLTALRERRELKRLRRRVEELEEQQSGAAVTSMPPQWSPAATIPMPGIVYQQARFPRYPPYR